MSRISKGFNEITMFDKAHCSFQIIKMNLSRSFDNVEIVSKYQGAKCVENFQKMHTQLPLNFLNIWKAIYKVFWCPCFFFFIRLYCWVLCTREREFFNEILTELKFWKMKMKCIFRYSWTRTSSMSIQETSLFGPRFEFFDSEKFYPWITHNASILGDTYTYSYIEIKSFKLEMWPTYPGRWSGCRSQSIHSYFRTKPFNFPTEPLIFRAGSQGRATFEGSPFFWISCTCACMCVPLLLCLLPMRSFSHPSIATSTFRSAAVRAASTHTPEPENAALVLLPSWTLEWASNRFTDPLGPNARSFFLPFSSHPSSVLFTVYRAREYDVNDICTMICSGTLSKFWICPQNSNNVIFGELYYFWPQKKKKRISSNLFYKKYWAYRFFYLQDFIDF